MAGILTVCRHCGRTGEQLQPICPACGGDTVHHPQLPVLSIAHVDCDAFYASIEKHDRPELADQPVIVGGGRRGVVTTACYIARTYGVRSAMPMFKALKACPHAVVVKPDFDKYRRIGHAIRQVMLELTPQVEPLSIDEAFLDLSGTSGARDGAVAKDLLALARRVREELGLTISIGLSSNKFLAKVASDFRKPEGFTVVGPDDAATFLALLPIETLWGVGPVTAAKLREEGFNTIADLQQASLHDLLRRHGTRGRALHALARGHDERKVRPVRETKSISSERTFDQDTKDPARLRAALSPLCDQVAARMKQKGFAGRTVTLKLKTTDFVLRTRSATLSHATQLSSVIEGAAERLLLGCLSTFPDRYRLIGVGMSGLSDARSADPPDLFQQNAAAEQRDSALEQIRQRYGEDAIKRADRPARNTPQQAGGGRSSRWRRS